MSLFWWSWLSNSLLEFLKTNYFISPGSERKIPLGAALELIGEIPLIREKIQAFITQFESGKDNLTSERYDATTTKLSEIGDIRIDNIIDSSMV